MIQRKYIKYYIGKYYLDDTKSYVEVTDYPLDI